jgi:Magnesium chelatase, subunit ChlI/Magnesium chelatase, subunit ChlI C-terminal
MMDLLKLTDLKLAALRQAVANECGRRSRLAVDGHDAAAIVYGNEIAKRAVVVAAAGKHPLLLLGPSNSGKTMLRAVAVALGLEEVFEARGCPCGEYGGGVNSVCRCTAAQIARHRRKLPIAEVNVELRRPAKWDGNRPGTSLADMQRQLANAFSRGKVHVALDTESQALLRVCVEYSGLDPVAEAAVREVACTIAALEQATEIRPVHVNEAINYRAFLADSEVAQPRRGRSKCAA